MDVLDGFLLVGFMELLLCFFDNIVVVFCVFFYDKLDCSDFVY